MTIQISWDNDAHTILRYQFEAEWRWEDLYRVINHGLRLADGRYTEVDTIFDVPYDVHVPSGNMLFHARRLLELMPLQHGIIVIVSNLPLLRNVVGIINQVYKTNFAIAHTLDEAHVLIAQHRASSETPSSGNPAQTSG
jgi:hypothetical protein